MPAPWALLALAALGLLSVASVASLPYDMDDDDLLLPRHSANDVVMDRDVMVQRNADMTSEDVTSPRERDAENRLRVADFVREVRRVLSGVRRRKSQTMQLEKRLQRVGKVNKRHCWDVADVCCMWNIC